MGREKDGEDGEGFGGGGGGVHPGDARGEGAANLVLDLLTAELIQE